MSTPIIALALAAMSALFAAAAADTAQAIGLRTQAADEARRIATITLDNCALGAEPAACRPPDECDEQHCFVCWRDDVVQAQVSLQWSPALLTGLTPAVGRHALDLGALDVEALLDAPSRDSIGRDRATLGPCE